MSLQFLVADLDRAVEFYTKKLFFEVEFRYEEFYVGIIKDGFSIHLKSGKPSCEEFEIKKDFEHIDIIFSVQEIERMYEDISGKSVQVIQGLRDMPYGKEFYISDPDGHIIAFVEEP
jgi:predicted enzyme related to lactoylglutathione lyase